MVRIEKIPSVLLGIFHLISVSTLLRASLSFFFPTKAFEAFPKISYG
jgi:hypothetical protein